MKIWHVASVALIIGTLAGVASALVQLANPGEELRQFLSARETKQSDSPLVAPQLVVKDGTEFNFGVMDRDDVQEHAFVFENAGSQPLSLQLGGTTCMCAVGKLGAKVIDPGQQSEVTLSWTPKNYAMNFRESADILTNDPRRPLVKLYVFGRIRPIVRAVPKNLGFSSITAGTTRSAETVIFAYQSDELEVQSYRWGRADTAASFEVDFRPADQQRIDDEKDARAGIVCRVTIKPGLSLGPFQQWLDLTMKTTVEKDVEVGIHGEIVGDIMIAGPREFDRRNRFLKMGHVSRDAGKKMKLILSVKGDRNRDVELRVLRTEPADVLLARFGEPRSVNNGASVLHQLEIEIPAGSRYANHLAGRDGQSPGVVEIATTHPNVPAISIRVGFAIAD